MNVFTCFGYFFLLTVILAGDSSVTPSNEAVGKYLSEGVHWKWPQGELESEQRQMYNILASWCGETYLDAVGDASKKSAQFQKLQDERDGRYRDWTQCKVEKIAQEQELKREYAKQQLVHNASFTSQKRKWQAEFESQISHLQADVEACELKLKQRAKATCDHDTAVAQASCIEEIETLKAAVAASEDKAKAVASDRCSKLDLELLKLQESTKNKCSSLESVNAELAACRQAKARAEAREKAVLADGTIASLESQVFWLQILLFVLFALLVGTTGAIAFLFLQEGGVSSITKSGSPGSPWTLPSPPTRMKLLSALQTSQELQQMFSGHSSEALLFPDVLLSTIAEGDGGSGSQMMTAFLLVPVNTVSSRRFSLFGAGGDYSPHLEAAQEMVQKAYPKGRLVVVLYEFSGCAFTQKTLLSLRLTADKIADEVAPGEGQLPSKTDIVVLWLSKPDGLCVATSEGESELSRVIKAQPWAEFLLGRSGRWGQFPSF